MMHRGNVSRRRGLRLGLLAVALLSAVLAGTSARAADETPVMVYGAASLTDALKEIATLWQGQGHPAPQPILAASSTLARQIENGAPADIFLSADQDWMDYLASRALIIPSTRADLLGNSLVLVGARAAAPVPVTLAPGVDLLKPAAGLPIATGDPDHVPVGRYAQQSLTALGVWDAVQGHLARADSVRAALALVERREANLGIVYATDAAISPQVVVLGTFPPASHAPITYPVATVAGHDRPEVRAFRAFLLTPPVTAVFQRFGFTVLGAPAPRP